MYASSTCDEAHNCLRAYAYLHTRPAKERGAHADALGTFTAAAGHTEGAWKRHLARFDPETTATAATIETTKRWIFNTQSCGTADVSFFFALLLLACFVPRFLSLFSIAERLVVGAVHPPPSPFSSPVHFFRCVLSCFFVV